ncbi:hypothetical protein [Spirillospora sp. NBC_01491]|uniref:hypothetical protein n=1 Tax=Spirillospora sp. NBC_01491 TaxID=2976007 RepID=UPI002E3687B5|nr:hypothetical protein [Spirillospora sp. NBC_01491]
MEPVSALVTALLAAWFITRGAADAAIGQARHEARAAAEAIREDLRERREAWAQRVLGRVADGRRGGPATGLWWAWAGLRVAGGVRRRMRREPRSAERARAIRDTTGPWRRVFDAAGGGARTAWNETRRQRKAQERPNRVPLGVCGRCGAVVALRSLTTVDGKQERLCVKCHGEQTAQQRHTDEPEAAPDAAQEAEPESTVVDAEIVEPIELEPATADSSRPVEGPSTPELPPGAEATPEPGSRPEPQPKQDTLPPVTPVAAIEGEPMPGQIVPRRNIPIAYARPKRPMSGESYTHGEWQRAVVAIGQCLEALPLELEAMLRQLTTADAGRSQIAGVLKLHQDTEMFLGQVADMLRRVELIERPVLNAVEAAGGPEEIAGIRYLSDV